MDEGPLLIGLTTKSGEDSWVERHSQNYINVLRARQAVPIILAPDSPTLLPDGRRFVPDAWGRLPAAVLDHLDGLILAGGGDVHPRYFGQEIAGANVDRISLLRDELELSLCRKALDLDMPILGICRGCQVLNVAAGGAMVQDFPNHSADTSYPKLHGIHLEEASRLRVLLESEALQVNTYHHQGIDDETLAPSLSPAARAKDDPWLLEAIESPQHRWVFGVQWHPERLFELPPAHTRIWSEFLRAGSAYRERRRTIDAHRSL